MTGSVITASPDIDIGEIARILKEKNKKTSCSGQRGKTIGIISRQEIVRVLSRKSQ